MNLQINGQSRKFDSPLLLAALNAGKSVVTANKALVAADRAVLHRTAQAAGVDLYYEGAVAGAIPLLRPLRPAGTRWSILTFRQPLRSRRSA